MPTSTTTPTSSLATRKRDTAGRLTEIADELRAMADDRDRRVFEPDGTHAVMVRLAGMRHWADRIEALAYEVTDG